jgi:hypothetical protein
MDGTDRLVLTWLIVVTILIGTAFGLTYRKVTNDANAELARVCKASQEAWDRSERFVAVAERLHLSYAPSLRAELQERPKCRG